jgi:ubiquitin C-terminal hydrolase
MAKEYHKLVINLYNEKDHKKSYSPNSFKEVLSKENPLFAGVQANDSKDLINFLLERLHQELNILKITQLNNMNNNMIPQEDQTNENSMLGLFLQEFSQKFNSPISSLFYGLLETKSQCKGCNIIKFNFQVYSFLEFPLQQVNQYFFNLGKKPLILPNNKNPDVNLYECFEYNKKIDLMTGENQMYCNICNKLCDALYSTVLYSSPNYLIINLNRGKGAVYECNVDFPEELNIVNYLTFKQNTTFDLYAVICHLGPSSMSGHFVAYIRNQSNYKWYLYNDSIVTECSRPSQYRDGMPYILFYKVLKGGPNAPY